MKQEKEKQHGMIAVTVLHTFVDSAVWPYAVMPGSVLHLPAERARMLVDRGLCIYTETESAEARASKVDAPEELKESGKKKRS